MEELGGCLYKAISLLVGLAVFVASWIYCVIEYGYLLGVGLGWLPSMIVGSLAALLWPVLLVGGVIAWWYFERMA